MLNHRMKLQVFEMSSFLSRDDRYILDTRIEKQTIKATLSEHLRIFNDIGWYLDRLHDGILWFL